VMFEVFSRVKQRHEVKIFSAYYSPIGYAPEKGLNFDGVITSTGFNRGHFPSYGPLFLFSLKESMRRIAKFNPDAVVVNNGYEYVNWLNRRCEGAVITYVGGTDWYKSLNILTHETLWKIPGVSQLA